MFFSAIALPLEHVTPTRVLSRCGARVMEVQLLQWEAFHVLATLALPQEWDRISTFAQSAVPQIRMSALRAETVHFWILPPGPVWVGSAVSQRQSSRFGRAWA